MAIYGPPPQPTALRVLNGNPGRRPLNDREPKPGAGPPRCPPYLDEEAKRQWKRLLPIVFVTYSLAYLDRSNYSLAVAGGMKEDLHITGGVSAFIGAAFFLGYFAFEVPEGRRSLALSSELRLVARDAKGKAVAVATVPADWNASFPWMRKGTPILTGACRRIIRN